MLKVPIVTVVVALMAGPVGSLPVDHMPENDHVRGRVFDDLRPARPGGACRDAFEITLDSGAALCTHGPDAGPPGVDVRTERSVADLALATATTEADGASGAGGVPCIGDGVSGNRVQAIYAVSADRPDRYADIAPLIPTWAAAVDHVFSHSAAQVGGERHVRFVTNAGCDLNIAHVVLSPTGDDSIVNTINELVGAGYGRSDRKYLIWMDAAVYCGIAQIYSDDRQGQDNPSNIRTGFARVDQGCWGGSHSTEAHELVHSLGGVQPTAPHGTTNFHCSDEHDRMCYKDGPDVVLTFDCPIEQAPYLDCNNDDYYHPNPPAGSYLDSHWNVASSSFLHAGPVDGPAPNAPPVVTAAAAEVAGGAALDGSVTDDGLPSPYEVTWTKVSGPGTATFAEAAAENTTVSLSDPGEYVLKLTAYDGELIGEDSVTITVGPTSITETFVGAITKRLPVYSVQTTVAQGPASGVLTFVSSSGKKPSPKLTLKLYDGGRNLVATASGQSPVSISVPLGAGSYTWEVSGASISFSLAVTHMAD